MEKAPDGDGAVYSAAKCAAVR